MTALRFSVSVLMVGLFMLITLPSCADAQDNAAEQAEAMMTGNLVGNVYTATKVEVGGKISLKQGVVSIEQEFKNGQIRDHTKTRGFRVLFGNLTAGQNGTGQLNTPPAIGAFYTDVEWQVISGYAMARGWRPRIRGTTATAAAEGTELICQNEQAIANDGTVTEITRIYLISGSPVRVRATDNLNYFEVLTTADHYIEARMVGEAAITLTEPIAIPADANDPLRKFVNDVRAISLAEGFF